MKCRVVREFARMVSKGNSVTHSVEQVIDVPEDVAERLIKSGYVVKDETKAPKADGGFKK